jgi:hypothetical protein
MIVSVEMGKRSDRLSVALPRHISEKAREVSALASKHGWTILGIDRDDPPTITAVFEAAIDLLHARAVQKKK